MGDPVIEVEYSPGQFLASFPSVVLEGPAHREWARDMPTECPSGLSEIQGVRGVVE